MRGTPFNAAYDNYLFTYSELSASLADGTFLQNNPGCPNTNNCVPAISASYYGRFATLGMPSNNLPTWGQVYAKRVASPTTATLYLSFDTNTFVAYLSTPISATVAVTTCTVYGYSNTTCSGAASYIANLGANLSLSAGEIIKTIPPNTDVPANVVRYNIANSIVINGVTKTHGQTIVIGGTTVTISIPYNSCNIYLQ